MAILLALLFAGALVLVLAPAGAATESRIALVIGNSAYKNTSPLPNPRSDAKLMTATLRELGFEVQEVIDADRRVMRRAMRDFGRRLRDSSSVGLFYYAGHGVQVNGENYLIPIDANIADETEVDLEGVEVNAFLRTMKRAANRINVVVLDACRNNPYASSFRSISRGLARVDAPSGTYIAYATAPGNVAEDGSSGNSPYTKALAKAMLEPGLTIEQVFKSARRDVLAATSGRQKPWEESSITGEFFFKPRLASLDPNQAMPQPAAPSAQTKLEADLALWDAVKNSADPALLRSYIARFPRGLFVAVAEHRLRQLMAETDAVPTVSPPAPAPQPVVTAAIAPSASDAPPAASAPTTPTLDDRDLAMQVQSELNRVGCDAGKPDGVWGTGSRAALERFRAHSKVTLAALEPTVDLLDTLKRQRERICPLVCGRAQVLKNGTCVAKTCPAGQRLSSRGACYTPQQRTTTRKPPAASTTKRTVRRGTTGGGNCFTFNGKRFCE